jgi:hypothetical protein
MPRALATLFAVLTLVLAACGGSQSASGGDGAAASGPGAGGGTNGDTPTSGAVYFGSAYDPATFAVTGRTTTIKAGATVVAVGKTLTRVDGTGIQLQLTSSGRSRAPRPPDAMDNPTSVSFLASDLTSDNLTPGTWTVSFLSANNRILASGFLTVTP